MYLMMVKREVARAWVHCQNDVLHSCCWLEMCTYFKLFVLTGMRGVVHLGLSQVDSVLEEGRSYLKTGVLYFSLGEKSGWEFSKFLPD